MIPAGAGDDASHPGLVSDWQQNLLTPPGAREDVCLSQPPKHISTSLLAVDLKLMPTVPGQLETSNFNANLSCISIYLVSELFLEKNRF